MSDFIQTMKDWRRMCKHYSDESMKNGQPSCEDMCPLGHNTACGIIEDALNSDIEVAAKEVAKWVAEHPESEYPTWYEWLSTTPFIEKVRCGSGTYKVYNWKKPIPADIAEKLGIEPK